MYTILIFPKSKELDKIEKIRNLYDPLASKIGAHITLVFPNAYDDLDFVIQKIKEIALEPFEVMPSGFIGSFEQKSNYLFINLNHADILHKLHDELYNKIMGSIPMIPYKPHLTVGCFEEKEDCKVALESVKDVNLVCPLLIDEICLERIEEDGKSTILYRHPLSLKTS